MSTALGDGGCDPVVIVVSPDRSTVVEEARRLPVTLIENADPGEGPITSLRLALSHLDQTDLGGVVWLPLDFPLVRAEHVELLLDGAHESGAPIVLFEHQGKRGHPVFFHRSLFPELVDPGLRGGARVVVHRHLAEAHLLEVDDDAVVTDVDTPEIYEAVSRRTDADLR